MRLQRVGHGNFNFLTNCQCSIASVQFYIPTSDTVANLSTLSSTLAIFCELDSSQSNGCEGLFLCRRRSLLNSQHDRNWEAMEVTM